MTAADEGAMRRPIAKRVAAWTGSGPKADPIMPRTSSGKVSRALTRQRYLEGTCTAERAR